MCVKKDYIWNPAICSYKNSKYVGSIIEDSVITCDEIKETTKTVPRKILSTKSTSTIFYILVAFFINYRSIFDSCQYLLTIL